MREVKEMCERLLEVPAPPATSPADLLGMARASVRRTRLLTAGGLTAVLASIAAIAVPLAAQQTAPPVDPQPSVSASREPVHLRFRDPVLRRMMAALESMPPPEGLKILHHGAGGATGQVPPAQNAYSVSVAYTRDSLASQPPAHQNLGEIEVRRFQEPRDPRFLRDPCRTDRMRELGLGPSIGCTVTDGVAIGSFERSPGFRFAIRHDGDWTILVLHSGGLFPDETLRQLILNPAFAS